MKKTALALAAAALLSVPALGHAALIEYSFTGLNGGDGYTSSGSILIDEADVAGGGNLVTKFASWSFTYTNGTNSFSLDDSTAYIDQSTGITASFFATAAAVTSADICFTGNGLNCFVGSVPTFGVTTTGWVGTLAGGATNGNRFAAGSWTAGTAAVPAPGALALVGLGLVGVALSRRKAA